MIEIKNRYTKEVIASETVSLWMRVKEWFQKLLK